ncbi:hypothetical protein SDC9_61298 [bioreactor metagenome]|uniref:Uncharacterized protein n=1 Tax=bioreactor metagenome TaxID=1076179 RepID=A0A644XLG4_9ZZZZ
MLNFFAFIFIGDTHFYFRHIIKNIETCNRKVIQAVQPCCRSDHNSVKPAAATRTAGNSTIFVAGFTQFVARAISINQLCNKRTFANAGRVSFYNTDNMINVTRTNAAACCSITGCRIGTCYKWVSTMVYIKESGLRTFKQDRFTALENFVKCSAGIGDIRTQFISVSCEFLQHLIIVKRFTAINFGDDSVFSIQLDF